jgi:hypothetical protein
MVNYISLIKLEGLSLATFSILKQSNIASKARADLGVALFKCLTHKYWNKLVMTKHSSLLCFSLSDEEKCLLNNFNRRPTFRYYSPWISLAATLLCMVVMFLMDWRTAIATYLGPML